MATKKCPVCGSSVKLENLERHVRNQHPRAGVDLETLVTKEERRLVERRSATRRRQKVTPGGLRIAIATIGIIALVLLAILLNPFRGSVRPGDMAPDFTLGRAPSGSVTLSDLRGSVVLLEFMDVDCPACKREAPILASVYGNYSLRGVRFLSVDVNFVGSPDTFDRMIEFKGTYGTPWDYVLDDSGRVTATYGVTATPTTFILDRNGRVTERFDSNHYPQGYPSYSSALEEALRV